MPGPAPFSHNDGIVITFRMLRGFEFEFYMYRYCKNVYIPGWRREQTIVYAVWKHSLFLRVHFIRLAHRVQTDTSASVLPLVYSTVVFSSLFRGTSLFVHTLAVMSQFVQWGMMCCWEWVFSFFRLNYWYNSIFKLSLISLFFNNVWK